jgi:hypothetical protein
MVTDIRYALAQVWRAQTELRGTQNMGVLDALLRAEEALGRALEAAERLGAEMDAELLEAAAEEREVEERLEVERALGIVPYGWDCIEGGSYEPTA